MTISEVVDARAVKIGSEEAWSLLKEAQSIITVKGAKERGWNPQDDDKAEILQHVMGPSGNLRAPTLRVNGDFLVGFNAALYESWLSKKC